MHLWKNSILIIEHVFEKVNMFLTGSICRPLKRTITLYLDLKIMIMCLKMMEELAHDIMNLKEGI